MTKPRTNSTVAAMLELSADCLNPATALQLHLAHIESAMLFPDDEEARRKALDSATVAFLRDNLADEKFGRAEFELAARAAPLADMRAAAIEPYRNGLLAGTVLVETIGKIQLGLKAATLGDSISATTKAFWRHKMGKRYWRVSEKTFNNKIWPQYKPVVHLWGAHWWRCVNGDDLEFPCHCSQINEFLRTATAFCQLAETLKAHKSPRPLLVKGDAIGVPFPLLPIDLKFRAASAHG